MPTTQAIVGVIMGSQSDWPKMEPACEILKQLQIPYEKEVVSAHRTTDKMIEYAKTAKGRGLKVIIAGAGGAAHLPGMVANSHPPPCGRGAGTDRFSRRPGLPPVDRSDAEGHSRGYHGSQ